MKNRSFALSMTLSLLACAAVALAGLLLGSRMLTPGQLLQGLFGNGQSVDSAIVRYARLPRVAASLLAGGGLAVAGAVLQTVLANQLASPGIVGVNAGAGLGVTVCSALGLLSGWAVSSFAFGGSLLAVLVLSVFASRRNASRTTVILGGVALNSILGAFSESIAVLDPDVAMLTTEFRVGGFSGVSYSRLVPAAVLILLALSLLLTLCNELDVVALGDETAKSIGLRAKKYRVIFMLLASLLAGAAVSVSGLLGFVGLIVPHFVRKLSGSESRRLLPLSAVIGGGFVCLCDTLARLLFLPYELPVGILMAVIGGPVFVAVLVRRKGGAQ